VLLLQRRSAHYQRSPPNKRLEVPKQWPLSTKPLLNYFFGGLSGPGSLTHPPVVPVRISQIQPPLQCTVVLHAPLQTGSKLAGVRSCRAETVPAQRTAVAIAASNVFLIVLFMVHSPFISVIASYLLLFPLWHDPGQLRRTKCGGRCGKGTDAIGGRTRLSSAARTAAGRSLDTAPQLPCGNRPCAQNSNSNNCKQQALDLLLHGLISFRLQDWERRRRYFSTVAPEWGAMNKTG
jgi:hypothetical protein